MNSWDRMERRKTDVHARAKQPNHICPEPYDHKMVEMTNAIRQRVTFTLIFLCLILIVIQGCSMTLPVHGQLEDGSIDFSGTATGYWGGHGDLKLIGSDGTLCAGNFVYVSSRQGEGVVRCNNGESGPFHFVSTGDTGTGYGLIGGRKFTFIFGQ